jgi:hypothetical protein
VLIVETAAWNADDEDSGILVISVVSMESIYLNSLVSWFLTTPFNNDSQVL